MSDTVVTRGIGGEVFVITETHWRFVDLIYVEIHVASALEQSSIES